MLLLSPPLYLMIVRKGEMSNNFTLKWGESKMFRRHWDGGGPGVVTLGARRTAAEHTPSCNVTTALGTWSSLMFGK